MPDGSDVARGAPFYPLVGAGIGALVGVTAAALADPLTPLLAAALALFVGAVVTGALHLDALADCADALGATPERALAIMRDHAVGAFGASALVLDQLVKAAALAALASERRVIAATVTAAALARAAPVLIAAALPYVRASGTASALLSIGRRRAIAAAPIAALLAVAVFGKNGLILAASALAVMAVIGLFARRWLGGITGDVLGATVELVETAVLVVAVSLG